ncbi:MAG TPA: hypothetical protein VM032_01950 [Vicinamibacterales bacterium]|nr:hypothetical protein [Vicinamibacterales bacterium]
MALNEDDPIPHGITSREAYRAIHRWYAANLSQLDRNDPYSQRSARYIQLMPKAASASADEMSDAFNQVLTGLLEWAYHQSDGSYKMAAYALAGQAAIGGVMPQESDPRFFGMPATIWVAVITTAAGLFAGYAGLRSGSRAMSEVDNVNQRIEINQNRVDELKATYTAVAAARSVSE